MKKFFFFISILFYLVACSSDKEEEEEEVATLELSQSEISFSANDETKDFDIRSNTSWIISDVPDWISTDVKEGKGNYKITLKSEKNTKEEERSATIKIVTKNKTKELRIQQNAKNVELSISKTELTFEADPSLEGLTFDITSNEPWVISNIPQWCTLSIDSGNGNTTISVIAIKNYIDTQRNANIKIKAGSKTQELKIDQKALNIEISFSDMNLQTWYASSTIDMGFYSEASANSIMIRSNTKWTVQSNAAWYTINKTNGTENEPITINVTENKNATDRNAEVIITAGTKSLKLIIRQGRHFEVLDDTPYQINLRDNAPHIGDRFIKKQVDYVNPGKSGENVIWNFSHLTTLNDHYEVSYTAPVLNEGVYRFGSNNLTFDPKQIAANSLIICNEGYTMYYYQIKDNQLQAVGHENSNNLLNYNPRMIIDKYPTYYKNSYKDNYQAENLYSGRIKMNTKGYRAIEADGYGSITLPSGTYSNVLRVKYTQTIEYTYIEGTTSTSDLKEMTDEYTIYKWYVKGYRYPVLETHRIVNIHTGLETFSTAFYFPPQEHTYLKQTGGQAEIISRKPLVKTKSDSRKTSRLERIVPILQLKR